MNDLLDCIIKSDLEAGYEDSLRELTTPVTIAIHKCNMKNPDDFYLDKFMNILGPQTYQDGVSIDHLYSTRDYFEDHEDYWRVAKKETAAIYRVHLSKKWAEQFVLKHKDVISKTFIDDEPGKRHYVQDHYKLNEETGEWELQYRSEIKQFAEHATSITSYKE